MTWPELGVYLLGRKVPPRIFLVLRSAFLYLSFSCVPPFFTRPPSPVLRSTFLHYSPFSFPPSTRFPFLTSVRFFLPFFLHLSDFINFPFGESCSLFVFVLLWFIAKVWSFLVKNLKITSSYCAVSLAEKVSKVNALTFFSVDSQPASFSLLRFGTCHLPMLDLDFFFFLLCEG